MRSLESGRSPQGNFRLPEQLKTDVQTWAARSGVSYSEAVRELLEAGLKGLVPSLHLRGNPRLRKEAINLDEVAVAYVPPGADWWDLENQLAALPGARRLDLYAGAKGWVGLTRQGLVALEEAFEGRLDRVRVYRTGNYPE